MLIFKVTSRSAIGPYDKAIFKKNSRHERVKTGRVCSENNEDTGELGYDGPLYDGFLHMTEHMHIKYSSYVYDRFCI